MLPAGAPQMEDAMTQTAPDPVAEAILTDDPERTGTIGHQREAAGW